MRRYRPISRCGPHNYEYIRADRGSFPDPSSITTGLLGIVHIKRQPFTTSIFVCVHCGKVLRV